MSVQRPSRRSRRGIVSVVLLALWMASCAGTRRSEVTFRDPNMDFSQIQRIAVLPFANLTQTTPAGERVRDVFTTMLQATGSVYVLPPGEVSRGIVRSHLAIATAPTPDEVVALGKEIKADVVISGTVREYGEVRSGSVAANAVAISLQMIETQSGTLVWSASSSKGGIGAGERLLGGSGEPMNVVTESAVRDLIDKLFASK